MTINIQGNSHQAISWFLNRNSTRQKGMGWWWSKGRTYNQEYSTQQDCPSYLMEKSKTFQTSKSKRIQDYQSSFITNAKGTSLGRKHKRRKIPTENKFKTVKKTVIGLYISIITLNIDGLNAPTKRHRLAGWMKTYVYALPLITSLYLIPQIAYNYFILFG